MIDRHFNSPHVFHIWNMRKALRRYTLCHFVYRTLENENPSSNQNLPDNSLKKRRECNVVSDSRWELWYSKWIWMCKQTEKKNYSIENISSYYK